MSESEHKNIGSFTSRHGSQYVYYSWRGLVYAVRYSDHPAGLGMSPLPKSAPSNLVLTVEIEDYDPGVIERLLLEKLEEIRFRIDRAKKRVLSPDRLKEINGRITRVQWEIEAMVSQLAAETGIGRKKAKRQLGRIDLHDELDELRRALALHYSSEKLLQRWREVTPEDCS